MNDVSLDKAIAFWKAYAEEQQPFIDETSPSAAQEAEKIALTALQNLSQLRQTFWESPHRLNTPSSQILLNKRFTVQICEFSAIVRRIVLCTSHLLSNEMSKTSFSCYLNELIKVVQNTLFESDIEELRPEFAIAKLRASTSRSAWEVLFGPKGVFPFPIVTFITGISNETTLKKWLRNAGLNSKDAFIALLEKEPPPPSTPPNSRLILPIKDAIALLKKESNALQVISPKKNSPFSQLKIKILAKIKHFIHSHNAFYKSKPTWIATTSFKPMTRQTTNAIEILYRFLQASKEKILENPEDCKAFARQFDYEFAIRQSKIIRTTPSMEPWDFLAQKEFAKRLEQEKFIQKQLYPIQVRKKKLYRDMHGNVRLKKYGSSMWMRPTIAHIESFANQNCHIAIDLDYLQVTIRANDIMQTARLLEIDRESGIIHLSNGFLHPIGATTYGFLDNLGNAERVEKLSNKGISVIRLQKIPLKKPKQKSKKNQERKFSDYGSMDPWSPTSSQSTSQVSLLPLQKQVD